MFSFFLFGRFEVHWNHQPLDGFESKKVQELISYLVTYRHRPHSRELLADLLWADYPVASSKKNLRQTLWQLQSALSVAEDNSQVLLVDSEFLSLNPHTNLVIDIEHFETVANTVQDLHGSDLNTTQAEMLCNAIELYRTDFLEGWYVDWCLIERERFHNLCLAMLDKLVAFYEVRREYETAVHYCSQALRKEYMRECTHRQLIRLHYLRGDRTAALRQYEHCKTVLADTLNVAPGQLTQNLYEYICADNRTAILQGGYKMAQDSGSRESISELVTCLLEMKEMITNMQTHVLKQLNDDMIG